MKKICSIIIALMLLISCTNNSKISFIPNECDSILIGKYKTEFVIIYGSGYNENRIIYSDNEIYTCSFQGTNYLLEKDNTEEILSTTAPIRILSSEIVK